MESKPIEKDVSPQDITPLQDVIYISNPFTTVRPGAMTRYLLVNLPGNPGICEFYRPFLSHLFSRLQSQHKDGTTIEVYAPSMAGFAVTPEGRRNQRSWLRPYSLTEQIDYMEQKVIAISEKMERQGVKPRIVLMGHSVGSYVLLELIRRHRKRLEHQNTDGTTDSLPHEPNIVGGVCLFPTVVNIGMSKKGKGLTKLSKIPGLPYVIGVAINLATWMIPTPLIRALAEKVGNASKSNAMIAAAWLKSGLLQAL
jgi:pimeloyl-ACP methyl ester carboxylesterase